MAVASIAPPADVPAERRKCCLVCKVKFEADASLFGMSAHAHLAEEHAESCVYHLPTSWEQQ